MSIDDDWFIDPKREGSIMCRFCYRQIQRCVCSGPNNTPIDTGPNSDEAIAARKVKYSNEI